MRFYRKVSSPRVISVRLTKIPNEPRWCSYCGQFVNFKTTPHMAVMEIDMGLGNLPMPIYVHKGCVNVIDERGRDANELPPM